MFSILNSSACFLKWSCGAIDKQTDNSNNALQLQIRTGICITGQMSHLKINHIIMGSVQ